jgi:rhodanese-related sulfurtransferase
MRTATIAGVLLLATLTACSPAEQQELPRSAAGTAAGAQPPAEAQPAPAAQAMPGTSAAATRAEPIYLDVRTVQEYQAGHVAGTLHIPVEELARRWTELEEYRDRDMVVYCRTGRRSGQAVRLLARHGFTRLENGGGLGQMAARGLRLEPEGCC